MRLRTIALIGILILGLLVRPLLAEAQPGKVYRIGYLSSRGESRPYSKAFRQGLRELGYIEGQNIVIMTRSVRDKGEAELVRLKVDVIVTQGGSPRLIRAAQGATRTIPGRQIADEADRRHPGLPILFMSGYTENAIIHQGKLDENVQLLQKPFRKADIARAVRKALDSARP